MGTPKYRVIQWATGGVGRAAIEGILAHPELELVGCWVHSAAKAGQDVGELRGIGPDRRARDARRRGAPRARRPTACCTPDHGEPRRGDPHPRVGQERRDAARLVLPGPGEKVADLEAACRKGGVTLHGTGIHPGGITERFPLMVSALSRSDHARARRGVLGHPHLRRTAGGRRGDALRQDARARPRRARCCAARRRLPAVDRHGGRRARLRARSEARRRTRWRSRRGRSSRRSARSSRATSRRSASPGRARCAASR